MARDDDTRQQDDRIRELQARAVAASHGRMMSYEAEGLSEALRERFWRRVVQAETGPATTLVKELSAIGVQLPQPEDLDDEALHAALWRVIEALATLHVYLEQTDHLSDRELYTRLLRDILPEEMDALEVDDDSAWHIDILGGWSLEDTALFLKYYADEQQREDWCRDVPDAAMPEHVDPPYNRDCRLPRDRRWS